MVGGRKLVRSQLAMAMCHRRRVCGAPALIRPDLADRAVFLTLEAIPEERQQPEQELGIKFEGERAVILGEPVGDRMRFLSEGNHGCLPNSHICFHYSTGMHDYAAPCTDWHVCYWLNWIFPVRIKTLNPDERITLSFADYLEHHDPVFERAVALAAQHGY